MRRTALAKLPPQVLRSEIVPSHSHIGMMHAEGLEFCVIALRQEAAFLARKAAAGLRLTRKEAKLLADVTMALVLLAKENTVGKAQAMLASDSYEGE
jgi:hypothetical protein